MADLKTSDLPEITTLAGADIIQVSQDQGGGLYDSKHIQVSNLKSEVADLKFGGLISGASSLVLNTRYIYSANSIATHTLPTTPSNGDRVMLDHNEDGTSIITISGNGKNIRQSPNPTASTIEIDLVGAHIEFIFSTDADEWIVANFSGPFGSSTVNGTVLTTRDMTNSGANDLNNIDITWQASWDTYDYVEIRVTRCKMNNAGLMAFALSADGGTTWESLYDKTKEAVFWTDTPTIVLTQETRSFTVRINLQEENKMLHFYDMVASRYTTDEVNLGDNVTVQGFEFNYSGTTLTNKIGILTSAGWQTNSLGLDGYMLRFTHEVGNFVNGTLKIVGYNYP